MYSEKVQIKRPIRKPNSVIVQLLFGCNEPSQKQTAKMGTQMTRMAIGLMCVKNSKKFDLNNLIGCSS